jgi:hypothetical protein
LISLLRTQLKSDLAIYGATYSGQLNEYESLFLERSDVDLPSKVWARAAGLDIWGYSQLTVVPCCVNGFTPRVGRRW